MKSSFAASGSLDIVLCAAAAGRCRVGPVTRVACPLNRSWAASALWLAVKRCVTADHVPEVRKAASQAG